MDLSYFLEAGMWKNQGWDMVGIDGLLNKVVETPEKLFG